MSPLNRGPIIGHKMPPTVMRPLPPPRFARAMPHGIPPRMLPPPPPPPLNPVFGGPGPGPIRQRLPLGPLGISRPNGLLPHFPSSRIYMGPNPIPLMRPRGPPIRWPRRAPLPLPLPPPPPSIRRFKAGNDHIKGKAINMKKINKFEELELKKPWMTDEIRSEIQKKNKLYAKAKKNKDAVEWEEFKDLRNKVTRMIRDAKNEYLAKHPEQDRKKTDDNCTIESKGVQKTENSTEQSKQMEQTEETQPSSEQAQQYPDDEQPYDLRDENNISSEDDTFYYCEICDKDFSSDDALTEHKNTHRLCGIDGCTFSAHPLLVEKHISMQHSTGLYMRMKNLSTPEDIEKWLVERKKKYPTKANIELCKAEELEKAQRGEIIKQNYNIQTKMKKTTKVRERRHKPRKRHIYVSNDNNSHIDQIYRGLRPFPGTSILQEENSNEMCLDEKVEQTNLYENITGDISDEEDIPQAHAESKSVNLAIPSLVANYESDIDEDEAPEEVPIKKIKVDLQDHKIVISAAVHKETSRNEQFSTNINDKSNKRIKADKISVYSDAKQTETETQNKQKYNANRLATNKGKEKMLNRHRNQLLEKLLSRSIQHERNLICQCVKYIVDNNFFDS